MPLENDMKIPNNGWNQSFESCILINHLEIAVHHNYM